MLRHTLQKALFPTRRKRDKTEERVLDERKGDGKMNWKRAKKKSGRKILSLTMHGKLAVKASFFRAESRGHAEQGWF